MRIGIACVFFAHTHRLPTCWRFLLFSGGFFASQFSANPAFPPTQVSDFIKYVEDQATQYRTDNVIITMGEDFTYTDASVWYKNIDKLIL